jgi:hypothetical protein
MTAQDTQGKLKHDSRYIAELFSPVASQNGAKPDYDEEAAQERRRQERLKRKREERREDESEEDDSENLLLGSRKAKRKKKKKERPALWVDDRDEEVLDEVFESNGRNGKSRRSHEEDWLGAWEESSDER